jgi:hypothetical protein
MTGTYPFQPVPDTSQRDYQELLASFRHVTEQLNALRRDTERLREVLDDLPNAWLQRSQFRALGLY